MCTFTSRCLWKHYKYTYIKQMCMRDGINPFDKITFSRTKHGNKMTINTIVYEQSKRRKTTFYHSAFVLGNLNNNQWWDHYRRQLGRLLHEYILQRNAGIKDIFKVTVSAAQGFYTICPLRNKKTWITIFFLFFFSLAPEIVIYLRHCTRKSFESHTSYSRMFAKKIRGYYLILIFFSYTPLIPEWFDATVVKRLNTLQPETCIETCRIQDLIS